MEIPIIQKSYDVYKQLITINNRIEKRWRYSLGQMTEETTLRLIEYSIMAKHAPDALKTAYLLKAIGYLEVLRFKMRLFIELKVVDNYTNIYIMQADNEEIGKMLGGWLRSLGKAKKSTDDIAVDFLEE